MTKVGAFKVAARTVLVENFTNAEGSKTVEEKSGRVTMQTEQKSEALFI
jgi:hypothetical protein